MPKAWLSLRCPALSHWWHSFHIFLSTFSSIPSLVLSLLLKASHSTPWWDVSGSAMHAHVPPIREGYLRIGRPTRLKTRILHKRPYQGRGIAGNAKLSSHRGPITAGFAKGTLAIAVFESQTDRPDASRKWTIIVLGLSTVSQISLFLISCGFCGTRSPQCAI
jgi:hypothetical protein